MMQAARCWAMRLYTCVTAHSPDRVPSGVSTLQPAENKAPTTKKKQLRVIMKKLSLLEVMRKVYHGLHIVKKAKNVKKAF